MDSEGNIYLIGDDAEKKKFLESLRLDSKYTDRHISKAEARKKGLTPINRPITRAEMGGMKIGRNSPCGCGSGLKFKRCCYGKTTT